MTAKARAAGLPQDTLNPVSFGWFIKKAALALAILFVAISCMAWLTHASIDPELDAQSAAPKTLAAPVTKVGLGL